MTTSQGDATARRVLFLGCGDLGTGAAHRLFRAGMRVAVVELAVPLAVRRAAAFAEAARAGEVQIEGVACRRVELASLRPPGPAADAVALVVSPLEAALAHFAPHAVVDARMAKRILPPLVPTRYFRVALGPGHEVGEDCDVVVETLRGPELGQLRWHGKASPDTGEPGEVGGHTAGRVVRAPQSGVLRLTVRAGATVRAGEKIGEVAGEPVRASIGGMVRGLLAEGDLVTGGQKLGDIDPRPAPPPLDQISDKARTIGDAVLTALLAGLGPH
jgi:xanthine dehydrogenase accessory factor